VSFALIRGKLSQRASVSLAAGARAWAVVAGARARKSSSFLSPPGRAPSWRPVFCAGGWRGVDVGKRGQRRVSWRAARAIDAADETLPCSFCPGCPSLAPSLRPRVGFSLAHLLHAVDHLIVALGLCVVRGVGGCREAERPRARRQRARGRAGGDEGRKRLKTPGPPLCVPRTRAASLGVIWGLSWPRRQADAPARPAWPCTRTPPGPSWLRLRAQGSRKVVEGRRGSTRRGLGLARSLSLGSRCG